MNDFVKGLIVGMVIVVAAILFIGAAKLDKVGRYRPFGTGVMDTKTGIARTISSAGWREFGEKSNYFITEYNFSEGKVTIWPIETENITSKKVYERLRAKIP